MWSDRRKKQLEAEGANLELVENTTKDFIDQMKENGLTIKEGILVIKKMDCILSEMTKCNPNSKIK